MSPRVRQAIAWVGSLAVLGLLFSRIPFGGVIDQLKTLPGWAVPLGLALLVGITVADTLATWSGFQRLIGPVSLKELTLARLVSYLLAAINYVVGQGALVVFLGRATNVPRTRIAAAVLAMAAGNFALLFALAAAGWLGPREPAALGAILVGVGIAAVGYAGLLVARPQAVSRMRVVSDLVSFGLGGHLWVTLVRLPHVVFLTSYSLALLWAFGVDVPLSSALVGLPIVWVISLIPVSVQGLGTSQAAMVALFSGHAVGKSPAEAEAAVLASSLFAFALMTVFQCLLGVVCLRTQVGASLRTEVTPPLSVEAPR